MQSFSTYPNLRTPTYIDAFQPSYFKTEIDSYCLP